MSDSLVKRRQLLILGFVLIVPFALLLDSRLLLAAGLDGQILSNLVAPLYFLLLVGTLRREQRLAVLMFVPVAIVAENIFSMVFRLYTYKFDAVPAYVPFGHAILLGTGLLIAESAFVKRYQRLLVVALLALYLVLIGVILAFGDSLSVLFGIVFAVIVYRKRGQFLYLSMGVLVLYVELLGTAVGCWVWHPTALYVFHTTNPPLGAFACYVVGDILAIKVTHRLTPLLRRAAITLPFTAGLATWAGLTPQNQFATTN